MRDDTAKLIDAETECQRLREQRNELLEALKDAVHLIEHLGGNAKLQRAAIAKVTGEKND